jgi:hypothetical protein
VQAKGLEATLRALRDAGVYFSFEEYKGRKEVVRHGKQINVEPDSFDNPFLRYYYETMTSGTSGAGTRVPTDLDHLAACTPEVMLGRYAQGLLHAPIGIWRGTLPDASGLHYVLYAVRMGNVPRKWFSPFAPRDFQPARRFRLASWFIVAAARLYGVPIPRPEPVPLDQAGIVARWAHEAVREHGCCFITTNGSMAVRVCIAARELGLDLTGVAFSGGGEPPSPAKVRELAQVGARAVPSYYFTEAGPVGMSCANPADENDQHFFKDALALIQHARLVPGAEVTVEAFLFTTLLPEAPKILLNVESDDYGVIERRACGCPLEAYGFTEHIRHIRSFSKLTSEGVTLVGSEMVHILEDVLPARFGGSSLSYQLLEEEDEQGFTRLSLLVSPEIEIADEGQVISVVLEELRGSSAAADVARAIWAQAQTLRVKRQKPICTPGGKLLPLHIAQRGNR